MTPSSALGRKLQRLDTVGRPTLPPRPAAPERAPPAGPHEGIGEARWTEAGTLHVTETRYPSTHRHGDALLAAALQANSAHVAALALDESLASVDLSRMLLLDTETTGLSGGSGTLPFLIGLGGFEPSGELVLEQLFLARPGEERPMLARLTERLERASCVVSFNGKSYDWPLLRTRFVMNRMPVPPAPKHLDLLHCARRIFRHRTASARLVELESSVLGHVRHGDVPGHLIPELYFSYLRHQRSGALSRVLEHNAHDLAMLAALLGHLARLFADAGAEIDQRDALGFAEVAFRAKDHLRADEFAAIAVRSNRREVACAAMLVRARIRWRLADYSGAARWLEHALPIADRSLAPGLHLTLAKLYEHRVRNVPSALTHAQRAQGAEPPPRAAIRLQRLRRKSATTSVQAL